MNTSRLVSLAVLCGGLVAGTAAVAASDYYIKLGGVQGESTERAQAGSSMEVQSWSWGASNPSAARAGAGGGAGKASMSDLSATESVKSPRDAASGQATGKRQHKPVAMDSGGTTGTTAVSADATVATVAPAGGVRSASVVMVGPANATSQQLDRACASGKHFDKVELVHRGQATEMHDVVVSSCAVAGNERRYEFRGHVTLMK